MHRWRDSGNAGESPRVRRKRTESGRGKGEGKEALKAKPRQASWHAFAQPDCGGLKTDSVYGSGYNADCLASAVFVTVIVVPDRIEVRSATFKSLKTIAKVPVICVIRSCPPASFPETAQSRSFPVRKMSFPASPKKTPLLAATWTSPPFAAPFSILLAFMQTTRLTWSFVTVMLQVTPSFVKPAPLSLCVPSTVVPLGIAYAEPMAWRRFFDSSQTSRSLLRSTAMLKQPVFCAFFASMENISVIPFALNFKEIKLRLLGWTGMPTSCRAYTDPDGGPAQAQAAQRAPWGRA